MLRSDHILGGMAIAAGAFLLMASTSIPVSAFITTLSARFFPQVMGVAAVALGILLIVRPRSTTVATSLGPLLSPRLIAMILLVGCFFLSFRHVDFRLGTAIFLLLSMLLMGARKPIELILVPIFGSIGMWIVFRYGFSILLPTWI